MAKKTEEKKTAAKEEIATPYFYAVGRRKTAVAQVRIYPQEKVEGKTTSDIIVNEKKFDEYFPVARLRESAKEPLVAIGLDGLFMVTVKVNGGGIMAQAEAIQLGLARAIVKNDATLKKSLSDRGYLTRDARVVERKKAGLKKARKAPQWAKR